MKKSRKPDMLAGPGCWSSAQKIAAFFKVVLVGFVLALIFHLAMNLFPEYARYPYNTFLFRPEDRFNDFRNILGPFASGANPYKWSFSVYFPATYIFLLPLRLVHRIAVWIFIAGVIYWLLKLVDRFFGDVLSRESLKKTKIFLAMSYPFIFALDRANLECGIFLLCLGGLLAWSRKREVLGSFLFGLAGGMKVYPLLYLLPDLVRWRWRRLLMTGGFVALTSICGLMILPGRISESLALLSRNLSGFQSDYVNSNHGIQHGVSLLGAVKLPWILSSIAEGGNGAEAHAFFSRIWGMVSAGGIFLMLLGAWLLRREDEWKIVVLGVAAMLLLPPVSYDYKLIHVLIPVMLFLRLEPGPNDRAFTYLFAALLIPKAYGYLLNDISIAVILNPVLILMAVAMVFVDRRKSAQA
jgi:hypothetical protein